MDALVRLLAIQILATHWTKLCITLFTYLIHFTYPRPFREGAEAGYVYLLKVFMHARRTIPLRVYMHLHVAIVLPILDDFLCSRRYGGGGRITQGRGGNREGAEAATSEELGENLLRESLRRAKYVIKVENEFDGFACENTDTRSR